MARSVSIHAWHVPARVTRDAPVHGQVFVSWRNEELSVRYGDARRFTDFAALLAAVRIAHPSGNAMKMVQRNLSSLPAYRLVTIGQIKGPKGWVVSAENRKHHGVALCADFVVWNCSRSTVCLQSVLAETSQQVEQRLPVLW